MTKIDYSKLFSYINRGADRETREEVERWRRADARHEAFYKRACDYYRNDPTVNKSFSAEQLDLLFADMLRERRRRRRLRLSAWSSVAASILLLVAAGAWFLTDRQPREAESPLARVQPSVSADEIVVITENGQRFTPEQVDKEVACQVSAGKLEYRDTLSSTSGNVVENEVRVPTHTIVVPRGKTFELRLSDGTYVLLSPSSSLTYPVRFDTVSAREVALEGEAFEAAALPASAVLGDALPAGTDQIISALNTAFSFSQFGESGYWFYLGSYKVFLPADSQGQVAADAVFLIRWADNAEI